MNHPDVLAAIAIRNKRDPLAVRRKSRLAVERHPARNQFRLAALDRQRINVAEQLEHDRLAVGRHIQRQPRSLIRRELDLPVRLQRQLLVFVLVVLLVFVVFLFILFIFLLRGGVLRGGIIRPARAASPPQGSHRRQNRREPSRSPQATAAHKRSSASKPFPTLQFMLHNESTTKRNGARCTPSGAKLYSASLRAAITQQPNALQTPCEAAVLRLHSSHTNSKISPRLRHPANRARLSNCLYRLTLLSALLIECSA